MNKRIRASWAEPYLTAELTGAPAFASVGEGAGRPVTTASDLRRIGNAIWIVEDDTACVARVKLGKGATGGRAPEAGAQLRGRQHVLYPDLVARHGSGSIAKAEKPDTECLARFTSGGHVRLLALSSGSTAARRRAALIDPGKTSIPVVGRGRLESFFAHLAVRWDIVGTELNLEGAVGFDGTIRLLQRGNGAVRAGRRGHNTAIDIGLDDFLGYLDAAFADPAAPFDHEMIRDLFAYDLGSIEGERLTFSGADELGPGWALYAAAAEQSPDVYRDGPTLGAVLGLMAEDGRAFQAPLRGADGKPVREKVEGIAAMASGGDTLELLLAVDPDSGAPSPLFPARLRGTLVERVLEECAGGRPASFVRRR